MLCRLGPGQSDYAAPLARLSSDGHAKQKRLLATETVEKKYPRSDEQKS